MRHDRDCCPACGREFRDIKGYPAVRILDFERLPIPEAIDTMSSVASVLQADARRAGRPDAMELGVNRTPEIAEACGQERVQIYLESLSRLVGTEVDPRCLNPPWEADGYFKFAHRLDMPPPREEWSRGDRLFLAVSEPYDDDDDATSPSEGERFAHVVVYGDGINFGSAGGPTLLRLGVIARIRYRGLLASELRGASPVEDASAS